MVWMGAEQTLQISWSDEVSGGGMKLLIHSGACPTAQADGRIVDGNDSCLGMSSTETVSALMFVSNTKPTWGRNSLPHGNSAY